MEDVVSSSEDAVEVGLSKYVVVCLSLAVKMVLPSVKVVFASSIVDVLLSLSDVVAVVLGSFLDEILSMVVVVGVT